MRIIGLIILLIIILIGVTFAMLNSDPVHFNYYVGQRDIALSLLLGLFLLLGILLGWLFTIPSLMGHRSRARRLRKRVKLAEQQLKELQHNHATNDEH